MKKLATFLFLIAIALFSLASCEDNTNDPVKSKSVEDFYPLTIGSWWKYQTKYFDKYSNLAETQYDSLYVYGKTTIDDKEVFVVIHYTIDEFGIIKSDEDGEYIDTTFIGYYGNKLIGYSPYNSFPDYPTETILDLDNNSWTYIDYEGLSADNSMTFSMDKNIICNVGSKNQYTYFKSNYECFERLMSSENKSYYIIGGKRTDNHIQSTENAVFAKSIGMLHNKKEYKNIQNNSKTTSLSLLINYSVE